MPLYEYECEKCSYHFDKMVMRYSVKVNCPICGGDVKKLMSTFSVGGAHGKTANLPADFGPKMCRNC